MVARPRGFTLIEVLVALAIVAITLVAGLRAAASLSSNARRQADVLVAQVCAQNELVRLRLARQLPPLGETAFGCEQAGRAFDGRMLVQPTPNPNFRRVETRVADGGHVLIRLATVMGNFQ